MGAGCAGFTAGLAGVVCAGFFGSVFVSVLGLASFGAGVVCALEITKEKKNIIVESTTLNFMVTYY